MGVRDGLPDFQTPIGAGATPLYAPFGRGPFAALPASVGVAMRQGQPAFSLSLVRRPDQPGPTGNYTVLDIELADDVRLDDALAAARAAAPGATVVPASIDLGFIRLVPGGAGVVLPATMTAPTPIGWSAAGARWTQRLDVDGGELIKGALLGGAALFSARLEFTVRGVAPRVPASAEFVPNALLSALLAGQSTIDLPALCERLVDASLPLMVTGPAPRADAIATIADRLLGAFGSFVPAAGVQGPPCFAIPGPLPTERLTWDLSQPAGAVRAFVLQLDPLSALSEMADRTSLIREVTIPPLDLGFREIVITANLPASRTGVPAIGVRISLPPNLPERPSGINTTAILAAPDDETRATFRLGQDQSLDYTATPFAIVAAGAVAEQLDGTPRNATDAWLHLQASDFPLTFAHIIASDRLLAQASVTGALTYSMRGSIATQPIALAPGKSDVAVAVPAGASDAAITLTASASGGRTAKLPPQPPGLIRLDFASFPAYGPHRIPIVCNFAGDGLSLKLDLQSEDGATSGSVTLTPGSPKATWGYIAASPFLAGFKVRASPGMWSAVLPPGRTLNFNPDGTMQDLSQPVAPFDIDGVHLSPSSDGATLYYVPASPSPELDGRGRPTLSVFKTPQVTTLQLGARLTLSDQEQQSLLAKAQAGYPSLAGIALQPAPIRVQKAAVVLADGSGEQTDLATSATSAFPPYAAVFSSSLTPAQAAQVISALGGRTGVLFVDYTIQPQGADAPVLKRTDVGTWFHGSDGQSHVNVIG